MKKISVKVCYTVSVLLLVGFIIKTIIDYGQYKSTLNSAPFYVWVIANMVWFIVPAVVALIVGLIIKSKTKPNNSNL